MLAVYGRKSRILKVNVDKWRFGVTNMAAALGAGHQILGLRPTWCITTQFVRIEAWQLADRAF